jgi:hypothetical protein
VDEREQNGYPTNFNMDIAEGSMPTEYPDENPAGDENDDGEV